MIVQIQENARREQVNNLVSWLESFDLRVRVSEELAGTTLGLVGDTGRLDIDQMRSMDIVEGVEAVREPYISASRKFRSSDTVIRTNGVSIGGGGLTMIAGPCSIESEEQILSIALKVKDAGADMLRGGAFKPRSSPYSFQGLGAEGLKMLLAAKKAAGLPVVSEIMDLSQLPLFEEVDVIQVGARNMQNFEILRELGKIRRPILLKRGLSSTFEELLLSAEYIMAGGNEEVILCERGIRTFETHTRNTLDISAVPILKQLSHLPVIVDPSHASGIARLVRPLALAAAAVGADGLMIEVHNAPELALCDGPQSITPEAYEEVARAARHVFGNVRACGEV